VPDFVELVDFDTFLNSADIVSLHCIVSPQTKNMFNKNTFAKMKKGSYFINTARGELVVEEDLIEALNSHHLAGAAIDVTVKEPISSDCPLLNAENLIITPHIAGSAYDVQVCGTQMICDTLEDWLEHKKPRNCVVYK
jgi:glycerate dehydrogenase